MGFAAAILAMVLLFAGCGQTETKSESSGTKSTGSESTVSESTQTESSTVASETEDETLVHVLALKGPTSMGMVKMMSDNDSKESPADTFELAAAPDEVSAKLVQGEVDIAAVPANLASVLYNKTNGGVQVLAVNTLGVLYIVEDGDTVSFGGIPTTMVPISAEEKRWQMAERREEGRPAGMWGSLVLLTLFVVLNLINSRSGRAIMASRDNRIAAEAMGVNVTKYKLMAFVTSAALAGMAGALFGLNFSSIAPDKFKFDTSILVLVFVVLGGIGNIRGSVIAAALLTVLPEALREVADYRMLVYAIVLILVMQATNNPTMKRFFASAKEKLTPGRKERAAL